MKLQYPQWGMLHTAAEGDTAAKDNRGDGGAGGVQRGLGRGMEEGRGRGGGGGVECGGGTSVPRVPDPKLIPE